MGLDRNFEAASCWRAEDWPGCCSIESASASASAYADLEDCQIADQRDAPVGCTYVEVDPVCCPSEVSISVLSQI